ncbi:MAG: acyltransferase family protein [Methanothrix sp.]|nr:acyltransferase family protein [Methanothrix sp.]
MDGRLEAGLEAGEAKPRGEEAGSGRRLYFVDNIRSFVIVQVVVLHAAVTYSGLGMWYYQEAAALEPLTALSFGIIQSFIQAYSLGLLFLVAGYFVPASFRRKGGARFLRDRAVRLGVPALIYMLMINPAILYYVTSLSAPNPTPTPAPTPIGFYLGYILGLQFLGGSGPMWFAIALLIFSAVYAAARLLRGDQEKKGEEAADGTEGAEGTGDDAKLPDHRDVIALVLVIAAAAFAIRLVQPIGTAVLNMQLSFFASYVALFAVGIAARQRRWLERIPYPFGIVWLKAALVGGTAFWLALFLFGIGPEGEISKTYGGLYWQSAAYALCEAFFCVGACLGIVVVFRERFNSGGRLARFMADNSFAVYFFHPVILILVTAALRGFAWHPLAKFAVAAAMAVPICFVASELVLRRIPLLKEVL